MHSRVLCGRRLRKEATRRILYAGSCAPRPLELTCQPTHAAAAKRQMTTPCPMRLAARPGMPCRLAQPACAASCAAGSAWLGSGLGLGVRIRVRVRVRGWG